MHFAHSRERETRERGRARRGRPTRLVAAARAVAPSPTGHRVPAASRGARLTVYAEESAPIEGAVAHRPGRPLGVSRRRPSHRARLGGRAGGVRASRGRRWTHLVAVARRLPENNTQPRSSTPFPTPPRAKPRVCSAGERDCAAPRAARRRRVGRRSTRAPRSARARAKRGVCLCVCSPYPQPQPLQAHCSDGDLHGVRAGTSG